MRTVVKAVLRSLSASTVSEVVSMEREMVGHKRAKEVSSCDYFPFAVLASEPRDINRDFVHKADSLTPVYQLSKYEETSFEELQDKECDYYPNISSRGDINVLNMDLKNNISELNVNSNNIIASLKNIRFVNSMVFDEQPDVFLSTANYIQRLLNVKAVKKDLMPFISVAMFDLALERKVGKCMVKDQVALVLSLSNIPVNHIEDFPRMKLLLMEQLNYDLASISVLDYLEILLKVNLNTVMDNAPDSHHHLTDLASIMATSCELTHFTLACQAISLVTVAARHVSFDKSFSNQFSDTIRKFPMIFVSPVRLNQFAKLDKIDEANIKQCAECIVRYISKYYSKCLPESVTKTLLIKKVEREAQLCTVIEEEEKLVCICRQPFDIIELMEKLDKVRTTISCQSNGKQKQRHKRMKKKMRRQLKRCDRGVMARASKPWVMEDEDDDDSAISSISNITSPCNSPVSCVD